MFLNINRQCFVEKLVRPGFLFLCSVNHDQKLTRLKALFVLKRMVVRNSQRDQAGDECSDSCATNGSCNQARERPHDDYPSHEREHEEAECPQYQTEETTVPSALPCSL